MLHHRQFAPPRSFLRLILGLGVIALAGCGSGSPGTPGSSSPGPATPVTKAPLQIETVDVKVGSGTPAQVSARVMGHIPDACTRALPPKVTRDGKSITVEILGQRPQGVFCAQIVQPYEQTVSLGNLPAGQYSLRVNNVKTEFSVA